MSIPRKATGICPNCKASIDFTIWDTMNTNLAPDLPQKITSGEFFDHKCPNCGFVCHLEYQTLYHDMKHSVLIWVVQPDDDYEKQLKEIEKSTKMFRGYSFRIVHSIAALREKVSIIEGGRDDRVIEFLKLLFVGQLENDCPDFKTRRAFYRKIGAKEYMEFYDAADNMKHCVLEDKMYREFEYLLKPTLEAERMPLVPVVGVQWAERIMIKFNQRIEREAADEGFTVKQLIAMRNLERENEEWKKQKQVSPQIDTTLRSSQPTAVFCRECGEKLIEGSKFCHKCGTEVILPQASTASKEPSTTSSPRTCIMGNPEHRAVNNAQTKQEKPKKSGRILKFLIVLALFGAVVWGTQNYWMAAFFYDIDIKGSQEITLEVGKLKTLSYTAEIGDHSNDDIEWESSDTSIATISSNGQIRAVGEGKATITASICGIKKDSCDVKVTLKAIPVKNGEMVIVPRKTDYPEVTVFAPSQANCFVYFKNKLDSTNDFAFYVKAGSCATVNAPKGTYTLYYATGENWYGPKLKFGQGSNFFKSPEAFTLSQDSSSYDILELTLYAVPNGNMDTNPIGENEFPV